MTSTATKQMPLKLWPMLPSPKDAPTSVSPGIFTKWNMLLTSKLNLISLGANQAEEEDSQLLLKEWEEENSTLQVSLLEAVLATCDENERRQIIQIHQVLITRLMNKIHTLGQSNDAAKSGLFVHLNALLGETLNFMEELMGRYFDRNEKLPIYHYLIARNILKSQLQVLEVAMVQQEVIDLHLKEVLLNQLNTILDDSHPAMTYIEIRCIEEMLSELLSVAQDGTTDKIRELLYYMNYNEDCFVAYEFQRLRQLTAHLEGSKQKAALLRLEQKKINQWPVKMNCSFAAFMPSLKEQVNGWINEEVKFFESGYIGQIVENGTLENESKIQTSLSVAKLAVIIRLLVVDRIIINRTIAPMLRIVAKLFTTLQRDEISFVSLESKYHAPEKATVAAVRDMLFKWIKILDKL